MKNYVKDGLMGLCIGDALGVPVEFMPRNKLKEEPVTGMRGYGTHNKPPGTWSDDSSLALCLADSLLSGLNYYDMAGKFCDWLTKAYWTPHGQTFGVGRTTLRSLSAIIDGEEPLEAGGNGERDNGNGSLMRILPLAFYLEGHEYENRFEIVRNASSITHGHKRSIIACGIYIQYAINLIRGLDMHKAYDLMKKDINEYYKEGKDPEYKREIEHFKRILDMDISSLDESDIKSSGYVVHTLEAALWSFLTTGSFKECVLRAVNLGEDTDTVGAVAGGIAGIYYAMENMPDEWVEQIARKDDIMALSKELAKKI